MNFTNNDISYYKEYISRINIDIDKVLDLNTTLDSKFAYTMKRMKTLKDMLDKSCVNIGKNINHYKVNMEYLSKLHRILNRLKYINRYLGNNFDDVRESITKMMELINKYEERFNKINTFMSHLVRLDYDSESSYKEQVKIIRTEADEIVSSFKGLFTKETIERINELSIINREADEGNLKGIFNDNTLDAVLKRIIELKDYIICSLDDIIYKQDRFLDRFEDYDYKDTFSDELLDYIRDDYYDSYDINFTLDMFDDNESFNTEYEHMCKSNPKLSKLEFMITKFKALCYDSPNRYIINKNDTWYYNEYTNEEYSNEYSD